MAVKDDKSLTIHGKRGRETNTGKRVKISGSGCNICRPEN
jgi:hypothetical protein